MNDTSTLIDQLEACIELVKSASISDETRSAIIAQGATFALFLSDVEMQRITPESSLKESMLELIGFYCEQVREILTTDPVEACHGN